MPLKTQSVIARKQNMGDSFNLIPLTQHDTSLNQHQDLLQIPSHHDLFHVLVIFLFDCHALYLHHHHHAAFQMHGVINIHVAEGHVESCMKENLGKEKEDRGSSSVGNNRRV